MLHTLAIWKCEEHLWRATASQNGSVSHKNNHLRRGGRRGDPTPDLTSSRLLTAHEQPDSRFIFSPSEKLNVSSHRRARVPAAMVLEYRAFVPEQAAGSQHTGLLAPPPGEGSCFRPAHDTAGSTWSFNFKNNHLFFYLKRQ